MSFSTGYTFGFAIAVCVVCSVSVASLSLGLRERQEANRRRDVQGNILVALGVKGEDGSPLWGEAIDEAWSRRVAFRAVDPQGKVLDASTGDVDGDGDLDGDDAKLAWEQVKGTDRAPAVLGVYVRKDGDADGAYAIPLYGQGLWGPLSGYLALDPHATEVTGVTFFAPKETPGLGAEIMQPKFKDQWVGKKVVDASGATTTIRVVKGHAENLCPDRVEHCVDGVSGATITSRGVDAMVEQALRWYDPYLKQLRRR